MFELMMTTYRKKRWLYGLVLALVGGVCFAAGDVTARAANPFAADPYLSGALNEKIASEALAAKRGDAQAAQWVKAVCPDYMRRVPSEADFEGERTWREGKSYLAPIGLWFCPDFTAHPPA
jgi:hypothetical protein